jgi:PAS domain S-box-containing protein
MKSKTVPVIRRLKGWRLAAFISILTIVGSRIDRCFHGASAERRSSNRLPHHRLGNCGTHHSIECRDNEGLLEELARQKHALTTNIETVQGRLKVALESTGEGVLMVAPDGKVLATNAQFAQMWNVPEAIAKSGDDTSLVNHVLDQLTDPEGFLAKVRQLYGNGEEASDILHFKDGRVFARYTRALGGDGGHGRIWCFRDVTVQENTRQQLAEREELFRSIFTQAKDAITLVDAQTLAFVEFNDTACETLGYSREEFAKLGVPDIQANLDAEYLHSRVSTALTEGFRNIETRHRHRDGSLRDVLVSISGVELRSCRYLVVTWTDITEIKSAGAALAASRKLLQTVIDTVPMRIFWKNRDSVYLGCNPAFATDAGKTNPADVVGRRDQDMGWAAQAELYRADDEAVMASGQSRLFYEEPQTTPEGALIWLRTSKVPLRDADGEVIGVLGVYEDFTERREMRDTLRQREIYQRALLDTFPFIVWLKDAESRFLSVNQGFAQAFGWPSPESLVGKSDLDIAPAELAQAYRADDRAVLDSGRARVVEEEIETNGRRVWFETFKSPVSIDGKVIGTVGFARDISERKRTEQHLLMAAEVSRTVFWELDFPSQRLDYDHGTLGYWVCSSSALRRP